MLRVFLIRRIPDTLRGVHVPVSPKPKPAGFDHQIMRGRKAHYASEESLPNVIYIARQVLGNHPLVRFVRHIGGFKKRVDLGRPQKRFAVEIIVKWPVSHEIADAEESLSMAIPYCESEVADDFYRASFAPGFVRAEDQFGVGIIT